jgi:anti-sigma-K factor RskA
MDRDREIIQKILDGDADAEEKKVLAQSMEADRELRKDFDGLVSAVRMLQESERQQAPPAFTAGVMRRLPKTKPSVLDRFREFLFGSRVMRWNMAAALATAVIMIGALVIASRAPRETTIHTAGPVEPAATIRLTFYSPEARRVAVAGDFNKWNTDAHEMRRVDGIWSIDLKLKSGVYTYSFIVDGKAWVPDPGAESYEDDGYGSRNSVLRITI